LLAFLNHGVRSENRRQDAGATNHGYAPRVDAWRDAADDARSPVGTAYVECGGLPPLFSGEACLARSEEQTNA
jgi:hypothetical protein